jgi:hypothetical protein
MLLCYHLLYYVHVLHVSIQLDHYQEIFHEINYSLLNCICMYFKCGSKSLIINMNFITVFVFLYILDINRKM